MSFVEEKEITAFTGDVQLRQKNNLVTSQEININRKEKKLVAKGKVKAFFHYKGKEKEELLTISSEEMELNHPERVIVFKNNNSLFLKNLKIFADEIKILLEKEKEGIIGIMAYQKIEVDWDEYQAFGEKAEYSPKEERLVLSNNVVLKDRQKGNEVKGTKLTFHLLDDRIMMENSDGRITTILNFGNEKKNGRTESREAV